MKTTFKWLATVMLLLITITVQAQPTWQWGKRGGSSSSESEQVIDMATDQNGNMYVLAKNGGSGIANVDGHTGISLYDRLSLASWNCNGEFRWMKTIGSNPGAVGEAIHVDTLGGIYI